jgi:SHS2 domain-containing protein
MLANIEAKYSMQIPEEKLKFVQECCSMLEKVYSGIEREIYIQKISAKTDIGANVLRAEIEKRMKRSKKAFEKERINNDIQKGIGWQDRVIADSSMHLSSVKKEENLLGLLLTRPEYMTDKVLSNILSEDIFLCDFTKRVYRAIRENVGEDSFDISMLGSEFSPDEMGRIIKFTLSREKLSNNSIDVAVELANSLKAISEKTQGDDTTDEGFLKSLENIKKSKK